MLASEAATGSAMNLANLCANELAKYGPASEAALNRMRVSWLRRRPGHGRDRRPASAQDEQDTARGARLDSWRRGLRSAFRPRRLAVAEA